MSTKGFWAGLFDFSFSEFVTTRVVKVLYVLMVVVAAGVGVVLFLTGFKNPVNFLFGPLVFVGYLIVGRISLETVIVIFRLAENVQYLADVKKGEGAPPPRLEQ